MSLYPETLTVLSRPDAHILSLGGLVGQRVDIGLPASGRQATAMRLLTALGLDRTDFGALLETLHRHRTGWIMRWRGSTRPC